jgi:Mobilization protein NikA
MQYNFFMKTEKSKIIQVRVTSEEKDGMIKASEFAGISLSSWVRQRLRISAIRELEAAGERVPFIRPIKLISGEHDE